MVGHHIGEWEVVRFGPVRVNGHAEVCQHEIRLAARSLESEAAVSQGFEPESGDRSRRNTRPHLVIIHGRHLAADQQGAVWL